MGEAMKKGGEMAAMAFTKRGALFVLIFVLLISAVALIVLYTRPSQPEAGTNLTGTEFKNLTILHIGGGALASQLVDRLDEMGGDIVRSSDIPEAMELKPEVVIIFGGEWFEGRVYDTELRDFLRLASDRGASLIMVGGTTSKFYEALDGAGIYEVPVTETGIVRNPAYFNPPLVGFRMKTVDGYTFPSLFFGCGSASGLEEGLIGWLTPTI